ncbi:filamentation induced by cAMP protein Fic [Fulvivirga imtechensis AK7]|uniref:Filamentation induced by cAMP protein Fic n=1 Tax=Fulvivirga imtechensis AK7 TaxID=1237149 RepID=L8JL08_9BACT|nr:Fic family protein [Fulvivirga imtechensis]ELR68179.1 filamentation induced by cAMP protein Fic [Fulvivirga imtechensis AK7]
MIDNRHQQILDFLKKNRECSSKEVFDNVALSVSYATLKRMLTDLISNNYIATKGQGKGTKYIISPTFEVIQPINIDQYYEKEIDEREIKEGFNFSIITEVLAKHSVFTENELLKLNELQDSFQRNISQLTENEYKKEFERLAIDLSWKSSQIEGNTYSLLETERLLKEKETAAGKTKEEATMLLNHKDALDFIIDNPGYLNPLSVSKIEDIHSILIKELAVERNLRKRRVGISGTNYKPLDNEFQILEALKSTCNVINNKESIFEKALLALVLISYIQPFMDGNKRTARIISNAILMNYNYCPLSFRTVDSIDYKKAMLLFYEQNNISNFKEIFINQFEFAVKTYF